MSVVTWGDDRVAGSKCIGWLRVAIVLLVVEQVISSGMSSAHTLYDYTYQDEYGWECQTRMWIPSNLPTVKGILIVGNGGGLDSRPAANESVYRRFAELFGFALIGTCNWGNMNSYEINSWEANLKILADLSGHPEIVNAPWAPIGFSNGGNMSCGFNAERPEKVLAFITNKGGNIANTSPGAESRNTPSILIAGEKDMEERRQVIHQYFTENRQQGALWSWVEQQGKDHEDAADRLLLPLMAEAIRLRYPKDQVPTATSGVTLLDLDETSGWLIDNSGPVTNATEMASYADYTGDRNTAGWLMNKGMACLFRAFATYDKDVSFIVSSDVVCHKPASANLTLQINTSAVPDWSKVELFDYEKCVYTAYSNGSLHDTATVNANLMELGVHSLYARVTHADGLTFSTTDLFTHITVPEPSTIMMLIVFGTCLALRFMARANSSRCHADFRLE